MFGDDDESSVVGVIAVVLEESLVVAVAIAVAVVVATAAAVAVAGVPVAGVAVILVELLPVDDAERIVIRRVRN